MSEQEFPGLCVDLRQPPPIPLGAQFRCGPGELLALVGPSGSGKTTILRSIAGLYRPRQGAISCTGRRWFDTSAGVCVSPQDRRVGLVFQDYALFPHLSAVDNVACALGHVPRLARRERAREFLALVHLDGLEAQRPGQLSGGQRQRVGLARALARAPAVLLLDEPFSAVDQVTRRKLQRELVLLRARIKIPMLLVTHDLDEAAALADRICVLHRGQTLQDGTPQDLRMRPRSPLVARLMDLGNVFEGVVIERRAAAGITLIQWHDYALEARDAGEIAPGTRVSWVIPSSHIVMHRRGRPSRGERENPIPGVVDELVCLGENTVVAMRVAGNRAVINFNLSTHTAQRNALVLGERLTVSLLADGIHLMPWSQTDP